jgi:membrane protein YdbS with pleckstrin-like domain
VTQNYFDRRLNLATLSVDTAGQTNTGGGPTISNLPIKEALRIQQVLISKVAFRPEKLFRR